ncbi:MAG: phospholipid-binding lipoprotein MlaA [Gammaproteobacteria bacterium]
MPPSGLEFMPKPMNLTARQAFSMVLLAGALITTGCATTESAQTDDPFEPMNRKLHAFNNAVDDAVLRPVSDGYVAVTTGWMRQGVTNFFNNVSYPSVILNDVLQGKFEQSLEDSMRLVFNSTLGLGGLFDFSTMVGLPANDEDFGQTLGVWGMDEIAYLELPLMGPSSGRDVTGLPVSAGVSLMRFLNSDLLFWPLTALNVVNARANLSGAIAIRDRSALDPYVFTREAYRQRRRFLIYDGDPPDTEFDKLEQSSSTLFDGIEMKSLPSSETAQESALGPEREGQTGMRAAGADGQLEGGKTTRTQQRS